MMGKKYEFKKFCRYLLWIVIILVICITIIKEKVFSEVSELSIEEISRKKLHHTKDGRFYNPWCLNCKKSFIDLLKWKFTKNSYSKEDLERSDFNIIETDLLKLNNSEGDYFVWLGQSTVLMRIGQNTIITDPIFGDINFFIKRKSPFPIDPENLPKIDFVFISHGHYDHLDTSSMEFLKKKFDPVFITGPGFDSYLTDLNISKHVTLNWWEEYLQNGMKITSLPVQHWSKRGIFDLNKMLWCSFLIEYNHRKYYWIGDTGYYRGYKEIGEKFGPIDLLFVPAGAYEPRWFMKESHANPEEALEIAKDVRAKKFIPIHWGTFALTDEPLWLPIKHLKEIYPKEEINPKLIVLDQGGEVTFSKKGD